MPYIVIDAGHGGWDNGFEFYGYKEKDINLLVATRVAARLQDLGFDVTLLRESDNDIGNTSVRGREIAKLKPDFALSFHLNSSGGGGEKKGAEMIVPLGKSQTGFELNLSRQLKSLNSLNRVSSQDSQTKAIFERAIDEENYRFVQTFDSRDYHAIIREAWSGGVAVSIVQLFYLDNRSDLRKFLDKKEDYIEAVVYALCETYDLPYDRLLRCQPQKSAPKQKSPYYRVICGAYTSLEEAKKVQQYISQEFPNAWIQPIDPQK